MILGGNVDLALDRIELHLLGLRRAHHARCITPATVLIAGTATGEVFVSDDAGDRWTTAASGLPPISKGGHYRWFLAQEQRERVEDAMRRSA